MRPHGPAAQTMPYWTDFPDASGVPHGKPSLLRLLARMVTYGHVAVTHGLPGPAAPVPGMVGPAELGSLAAGLLRMLWEAYGPLEAMGAYVRQGAMGVE